jgi:hypothetical protein
MSDRQKILDDLHGALGRVIAEALNGLEDQEVAMGIGQLMLRDEVVFDIHCSMEPLTVKVDISSRDGEIKPQTLLNIGYDKNSMN